MNSKRSHGTVFLFLHIFVGSALIWLAYTYALEFFRDKVALTWLRWLLEATLITALTIWGNIGWDRHKDISSGEITLWSAIAKSTYIPLLALITTLFAVIAFTDLYGGQQELRSGRIGVGVALILIASILFAIYKVDQVGRGKFGS